jgi:tetratricopeptide (TPR) repeat protein
MQGHVGFVQDLYETLVAHYPRDYYTEFQHGRFCREFLGEYFEARNHLRYATVIYPDGLDAYFQLGLLYDLLGMPELAFQFEEQAYELAKVADDELYKLRAHLSFNQAVAMWQASRPYGDIKAYLNRALDEWPEYERAQGFLESLPEDNDLDPRGRYAMQRFADDVRKNRPAFQIIDPD